MDWVAISSLATAGGTLVLAGATFASVRSANRTARAAERSLLAGLRPLLVTSRLDDPVQKVTFADGKWVAVPGGGGVAEASDEAVYLAIGVRNAASGLALLHGWRFFPERRLGRDEHPDPDDFTRLSRDIYVPAGDQGFWQGTFRDPSSPEFAAAKRSIDGGEPMTVDVLYGDHEGGQRVVSRFSLLPRDDGKWMAAVSRHWNVDRDDPR
jgi:hypothetical protein